MAEYPDSDAAALARENDDLRQQLFEAQDLINAIRTGAVDALAVQGPEGPRIFTLAGADERYRTLIEQMSEGAVLLGPDATILYCNACLAGWLGQGLEGVIGSSFETFVPSELEGTWQTLLEQGWAGKGKGELAVRASDGTLRPLSLSMNVLPLGDMPVLAVIATDLSAEQEIRDIRAQVAEQNALIDRKNEELKAQEAVRQTSERAAAEARRVLEGIPQIAWTANAQGQITYLNSRWFDYTGQTPGLLPLPVQWQAHLHPDDAAAVAARWAQCLASSEAFDVEYRFRDRSGNYRWMLGRALPSRSEQGDVLQWIGTSTDIHEHKLALGRIAQAQRQLRHNNEQLTRANVDLDNFIYTASHDLKAPITNIEGLLQALEIELPAESHAEAEVPAILGMMHDSVTRFKKTIEQLTDVSKLQKEQGQPVETASLAAVVRDVCLDLGPQIEGSGAVMDVDVSQCPEVRISGKNLRSVVYNLLSNALKYHHPDRPPHVRVRCHSAPLHDVLTVQDNGLGLSLANQQQLFGMFQRFHDHVEGSGIGLYMVKKMVTNAGGRIAVQSEEGQGTTFSVYFARS